MKAFELLWEFGCEGSVISVAATSNCSTICATTVGRNVHLVDGDGRAIWESPYVVDHEAWACAISEDSLHVAVGTALKTPADGTLYVLTRDKRPFWSTRIRSPVWGVSLSADGGVLAASTWGGNQLHLFRRRGAQYEEVARPVIPGASGLYGVKLSRDGQWCVVASYESGLYWVDMEGRVIARTPIVSGLYNVAVASATGAVHVGTRDGTFAVSSAAEQGSWQASPAIAQRPVCGIAVSENGLLAACGSFDGRVVVANDKGGALWEFQTKGEVWTTAMSTNAALVCAGSGDQKLRLFRNYCDTSAYQEIQRLETALETSGEGAIHLLEPLIGLYARYDLVGYGHARLSNFIHSHPKSHVVRDELRKFLETAAQEGGQRSRASFLLADILVEEKRYQQAIPHLHQAAALPVLRSTAQQRAADCFTELGLKTAATSAWRQSRALHLDDGARHTLFMLARSYEDSGHWDEAARIYETIVSWDASYRDSWDKLKTARTFRGGSAARRQAGGLGLAASLLGPDAPTDLDQSLLGVLQARRRELLMDPDECEHVRSTVGDLLADPVYSRGIRRDSSHFSYDLQLFLRYEFGLPEDEMKKFLETVNALPHFQQALGRRAAPASLDIGSATGRYPILLTRMGFHAMGIDIAEEAIRYSREKAGAAEWPQFIHGDACEMGRHLPADIGFDVVTCMMGTFDHIPRARQQALISAIHARLVPGGVAIISLWDAQCPHLAYLSIYDEGQKEKIRQNSSSWEDMRAMFRQAGFDEILIKPFCLLPQTVIYDLGIERMGATDIEIAAQADVAARAMFRDRHGEMFLAIGYRHR